MPRCHGEVCSPEVGAGDPAAGTLSGPGAGSLPFPPPPGGFPHSNPPPSSQFPCNLFPPPNCFLRQVSAFRKGGKKACSDAQISRATPFSPALHLLIASQLLNGFVQKLGSVCLVTQPCPTLCHWTVGSSVHGDSPGKNPGVGSLSLLQGIFSTQGLNPGLPHCRRILYCLSHQGSP